VFVLFWYWTHAECDLTQDGGQRDLSHVGYNTCVI